ncbi:DUF2304 domain-containing protein [Lactococcus nasutitermitis]|uniref:DUF2304 domain-containing protein n=1 Tax=Lactococcus nasutitermitis TaxID=1652957 RepID=A0ABV9JF14_9LACT|nr:DUF2304 domain-containing protein [Lactococcus nasutitermitis]
MPVQLRILAIILAIIFFIYTVQLVRKDRAEIRHMLKWLVLALLILFGAIFSDLGSKIAHILGINTLSSLALFMLVAMLVIICLKYQMSLISAEKQIKNLVQELSLLKKEVEDVESKQKNK